MIDTFSGIGGFSLAARWLGGFKTVQFVEREPFCQRILRKHWPDVPIHDDICTFNPAPGSADVVVGGFPCQDISQAGKGAGLAGERSGLFYELLRVVRLVGPRYVVLENVAAILGRGLDDVLGALAEAGYDCEWACIPASAVGACHQRDRWWCVAYPTGEQRDDVRGERSGQQAESELGDGDGANAADSSSPRRRQDASGAHGDEAAHERRATPDDHVALSSGPQRNATAGLAAPDPHRHRLEGPDELAGRRPQWPPAPLRLSPDWGGVCISTRSLSRR